MIQDHLLEGAAIGADASQVNARLQAGEGKPRGADGLKHPRTVHRVEFGRTHRDALAHRNEAVLEVDADGIDKNCLALDAGRGSTGSAFALDQD